MPLRPNVRCLRGARSTDHGLTCQNRHGTPRQVAASIDAGRTPWLEEPACRSCHAAACGEPVDQL